MGKIVAFAGGPLAVSAASGGKLYAYNTIDATTPVEVAPENPSRQKITFHNPGTVDLYVFPEFKINSGSDAANAPTVAAPGGSFLVYANGGTLTIEGECQQAWFALAASGTSDKPLTVMDSNT